MPGGDTGTVEEIYHTVTFCDDDGSILQTVKVKAGTGVDCSSIRPQKDGEESFYYEFMGWTNKVALSSVRSDLTVYAVYKKVYYQYTVTFLNYDGSVLASVTVDHGKPAEYPYDTPTREPDGEYAYSFIGWEGGDISKVSCDTFVKATYSATEMVKYCEVVFVDFDGKVLATVQTEYGTVAVYPHDAPKRGADENYTYVFVGFAGEDEPILKDTVLTATYLETPIQKTYTVTYLNYNGEILGTSEVPENESAEYTGNTPARESDEDGIWIFVGWDKDTESVTDDITVRAIFEKVYHYYTVYFYDAYGSVFYSATVKAGDPIVYPTGTPEKDSDERIKYVFSHWDIDADTVNSDLFIYPVFTEELITATVTFLNDDGSLLYSYEALLGDRAVYMGGVPVKEGTEAFYYEFWSWDKELDEIWGDVTFTAIYIKHYHRFTVTYVDRHGSEIYSCEVEYGQSLELSLYVENIYESNGVFYSFLGWDKDVSCVTSDTTVSPIYKEIPKEYILDDSVYRFGKDNYGEYGYTLVKYGGDESEVYLPETVCGVKLTTIGKYAFLSNKNLTEIHLSDSLRFIDSKAFMLCSSLKSVHVPEGASLLEIGYEAFVYCDALCELYIEDPAHWAEVFALSSPLENEHLECTLYVGGEKVNDLIIEGVSCLRDGFKGADNLVSVTVISDYIDIVDSTFSGCDNLTRVELRARIDRIYSIVRDCPRLEMVLLAGEVSQIYEAPVRDSGVGVFCTTLADGSLSFDESIDSDAKDLPLYYDYEAGKLFRLGDYVYYVGADSELTVVKYIADSDDVVIPSTVQHDGAEYTVTSIGRYAFYRKELSSVQIPSTVTSIEKYAFAECRNITSIDFGDTLESIGEYAFYMAISGGLFDLPDSLETIGDSAFAMCNVNADFIVKSGVQTVGKEAFGSRLYLMQDERPLGFDENFAAREELLYYLGGGEVVLYDGMYFTLGTDGTASLLMCPIESEYVEIPARIIHGTAEYTVTELGILAFYNNEYVNCVYVHKDVTSITFYDSHRYFIIYEGDSVPLGFAEGTGGYLCYGAPRDRIIFNDGYAYVTVDGGVKIICYYGSERSEYLPDSVTLDRVDYEVVGVNSNAVWPIADDTTFYTSKNYENVEYKNIDKSRIVLYDGIEYYVYEDYAVATRYVLDTGVASVAAYVTLDGAEYPVVGLGYDWLTDSDGVHTLVIPDTVKWFRYFGARSLMEVRYEGDLLSYLDVRYINDRGIILFGLFSVLGDGAELYIEDELIKGDLVIPKEAELLSSDSFSGYSHIETLQFEAGSKCTRLDIRGCDRLKSIIMPEGIVYFVCSNNYELEYVYLSSTVDYIPAYAFSLCYKLETVEISEDAVITSIEVEAFSYCKSLKNIILPLESDVKSIGQSAFRSCYLLDFIYIPGKNLESVASGAFDYNTVVVFESLPTDGWSYTEYGEDHTGVSPDELIADDNVVYVIRDGSLVLVRYLGDDKKITVPESLTIGESEIKVTKIGYKAFYYNETLEEIRFSGNSAIERIDDYAINNCSKLRSLVIPASVRSIGFRAIKSGSIKYLAFAEGSIIEYLDEYAILAGTNDSYLVLPTTLISIEYFALSSVDVIYLNVEGLPDGFIDGWTFANKIYFKGQWEYDSAGIPRPLCEEGESA
ncbi:MAG: leucine-rich repeat domain-containing protein [Clostridia bacterium]|nr:leucine-rich repeat domain-containing protein [Clostridia bacterium]